MSATFIKVRCNRTERAVWVNRQEFENGNSSQLWGQYSPTDETGWFFYRDDLVKIS